MSKETLSVIILTKNEEEHIARCINSASGWADEIIVIDDESTDSTCHIAEQYGAKIIRRKLNQDFTAQRNFGIKQSSCEWIYFLDADEALPGPLKYEIKERIAKEHYSAYRIEIKNYFYGYILKYSGIKEFKIRLFKKESAYFSGKIHEKLIVNGQIGTLNNFFTHYIPQSINRLINKTLHYTEIDVKNYVDVSTISWKEIKYRLTWKSLKLFGKLYIKKKGYKDGMYGLIWCILNVMSTQIRWLKIWEKALKEGNLGQRAI